MQKLGLRVIRYVFSFHTRLDALDGGVNDCLCALLSLENVSAFGECGIGRVGDLPTPMTAEELARLAKELLGADGVLLSECGKVCRRVAVLGGEGGDDIYAAISAGADTYISGRLGYHAMTDAPDMGINLIEAECLWRTFGFFYLLPKIGRIIRAYRRHTALEREWKS